MTCIREATYLDAEGRLVLVVAVVGRRTHTVAVADSRRTSAKVQLLSSCTINPPDCIHTVVAQVSAGRRHCMAVEARQALVEGTGRTVVGCKVCQKGVEIMFPKGS